VEEPLDGAAGRSASGDVVDEQIADEKISGRRLDDEVGAGTR